MAITYNPENERLKRAYLTYMREAQQHSEASLDSIAKAIHRFETYTRFRAFRGLSHRAGHSFQAPSGQQPERAERGAPEPRDAIQHPRGAQGLFPLACRPAGLQATTSVRGCRLLQHVARR